MRKASLVTKTAIFLEGTERFFHVRQPTLICNSMQVNEPDKPKSFEGVHRNILPLISVGSEQKVSKTNARQQNHGAPRYARKMKKIFLGRAQRHFLEHIKSVKKILNLKAALFAVIFFRESPRPDGDTYARSGTLLPIRNIGAA